jgi:hypothetical protein
LVFIFWRVYWFGVLRDSGEGHKIKAVILPGAQEPAGFIPRANRFIGIFRFLDTCPKGVTSSIFRVLERGSLDAVPRNVAFSGFKFHGLACFWFLVSGLAEN